MTPRQNDILSILACLSPAEAADLAFSTRVTEILQTAARTYKSSPQYKTALRPLGTTNARVTPTSSAQPSILDKIRVKKTPAQPKLTVAQREKKIVDWARANVKVGQIVQMTGTRDKHGVRKVVDVTTSRVICKRYAEIPAQAAVRYLKNEVIQIANKFYVEMRDVTSHGLEKVDCVYDQIGVRLYKRAPVL